MADIVARYVGNKRVEAENPRSGGRLTFDQGKPDGLGESYDPVEGLLGAFAGCTLTMIAYAAEANGADAKGATAECDCTMAERPHRIASITLSIRMPQAEYTDSQKKVIQKYADACPVGLALSDKIDKKVEILWP